MVSIIRTLTFSSLALLLAALLLPFERPMTVSIPLDRPPPMWVLGAALLLGGFAIGAVASVGLIRLKRWGRLLATAASAFVLIAVWLLAQSPLASHVGSFSTALFAVGALAWLCGVALSYHPLVAPRFHA